MRYIEFGTRNMSLSEIMLGTMRIGDMENEEVAALLDAALEAGINALDTADIYGSTRPCEEILGEVFAARPGMRDRFYIQTKCGISSYGTCRSRDYSKEHILASVDQSLTRMQTDHIDALLLHRPDVLMVPEEVADALKTLHDAGKVLDFGVSNQNPAQMELLEHYVGLPLVTNQIQLSLTHSPAFDAALHVNELGDGTVMRDGGIFEHCYRRGMAIQAWSPLQYGQSDGSFLDRRRYSGINRTLNRMAEERGVSPAAIALAWVLRHPAKMQAIVGTTRPGRVLAAAHACDFELSGGEWYELYTSGDKRLP